MMNEVEQALKERLVLELTYDGGIRLVEPHVHFVDKEGCELLRVWQVDGYSHTGNLPQWRSFKLDGLADVRILRTHFAMRPDVDKELQALSGARVLARVG